MKKSRILTASLAAVSMMTVSACVTDPNTGERKVSRTVLGTAGGALAGGLLGGVINACTAPTAPANGKVSVTKSSAGGAPDGYVFGAKAVYSCDAGFSRSGPAEVACTVAGTPATVHAKERTGTRDAKSSAARGGGAHRATSSAVDFSESGAHLGATKEMVVDSDSG